MGALTPISQLDVHPLMNTVCCEVVVDVIVTCALCVYPLTYCGTRFDDTPVG